MKNVHCEFTRFEMGMNVRAGWAGLGYLSHIHTVRTGRRGRP
jgi:hypothetical protein